MEREMDTELVLVRVQELKFHFFGSRLVSLSVQASKSDGRSLRRLHILST